MPRSPLQTVMEWGSQGLQRKRNIKSNSLEEQKRQQQMLVNCSIETEMSIFQGHFESEQQE